jgi:plasmid replication initiation protein
MKKDLVAKPNQLIEIVGVISGVQTKMYNVILARAQQQLKIEDTEEFILELSDVINISGIKNKNQNQIRNYLSDLLKISIEYTDSKGDWGGFNLISSYKKIGNQVKIGLPKEIRVALMENNYYSTLDLLMMSKLEGKHAITLYEIAIKYHKVKIPEYSIEEFRKLTNTLKSKSYDNFARLKAKVIIPAIEEINEKTDMNISYTVRKKGRKIEFINFKTKNKKSEIRNVSFGGNERDTAYDNENYIETEANKINDINLNVTFSGNDKDTLSDNKTIPLDDFPKSKGTKVKIKSKTKVTTHSKTTLSDNKDTSSDKLEKSIVKAKRNIYVSKAWNKRVETKILKLLRENGEEYTLDILKRLYESVKQDIKTTLVQYINGIMKNIKEEGKTLPSDGFSQSRETKVKMVGKDEKKEEVTEVISNKLLPKEENENQEDMTFEEFEKLDVKIREQLEKEAIELTVKKEKIPRKFLLDLKKKSIKIYFNTIKSNIEVE